MAKHAVPPLTPRDEQAMVDGLLPGGSAAGAVLGWMARDLTGLKVGLALGGGASRGYARAIIGCLVALGHSLDAIADILDRGSPTVFHPTLPRKALLSDAGLQRFISRMTGDAHFEELRIPLAIVAADIASGQEVVFTRGLL